MNSWRSSFESVKKVKYVNCHCWVCSGYWGRQGIVWGGSLNRLCIWLALSLVTVWSRSPNWRRRKWIFNYFLSKDDTAGVSAPCMTSAFYSYMSPGILEDVLSDSSCRISIWSDHLENSLLSIIVVLSRQDICARRGICHKPLKSLRWSWAILACICRQAARANVQDKVYACIC